VDIDLSIPDDFDDLEDVKRGIFKSLKDRFDSAGYVVFDESSIGSRPAPAKA
jgi:hypothetical protein